MSGFEKKDTIIIRTLFENAKTMHPADAEVIQKVIDTFIHIHKEIRFPLLALALGRTKFFKDFLLTNQSDTIPEIPNLEQKILDIISNQLAIAVHLPEVLEEILNSFTALTNESLPKTSPKPSVDVIIDDKGPIIQLVYDGQVYQLATTDQLTTTNNLRVLIKNMGNWVFSNELYPNAQTRPFSINSSNPATKEKQLLSHNKKSATITQTDLSRLNYEFGRKGIPLTIEMHQPDGNEAIAYRLRSVEVIENSHTTVGYTAN